MKDTVTNKELFSAIMDSRDRSDSSTAGLHKKIDDLVEKRITPLERTVDKIWIYWSMGVVLLSFVGTMTFDWIKIKFFRNL